MRLCRILRLSACGKQWRVNFLKSNDPLASLVQSSASRLLRPGRASERLHSQNASAATRNEIERYRESSVWGLFCAAEAEACRGEIA